LRRSRYRGAVSDADPNPGPGEATASAYPGPRPAPYGSGPYATPPQLPAAPERPLVEMADVWTALLGIVGVLLVGVVATFVWIWVSPRVLAVKDAKGGVALSQPYPKGFVGADVTFLLVTLVAGVLCAVIAALVARHRGLAVSVAMAAGGILASLMVAWLGRWLTGGPLSRWVDDAAVGSHHLFIQLQSRPFVVAWPVVALLITFAVALATGGRARADARRQAGMNGPAKPVKPPAA
jgi:hypothetical protein